MECINYLLIKASNFFITVHSRRSSNSWLCLLPKYSHFSLTNSFQFQFSMQILTTEVVGCLYSKFSIILMQNRLSSSTELFVLLQFKFSSTLVGAVSSEW